MSVTLKAVSVALLSAASAFNAAAGNLPAAVLLGSAAGLSIVALRAEATADVNRAVTAEKLDSCDRLLAEIKDEIDISTDKPPSSDPLRKPPQP